MIPISDIKVNQIMHAAIFCSLIKAGNICPCEFSSDDSDDNNNINNCLSLYIIRALDNCFVTNVQL